MAFTITDSRTLFTANDTVGGWDEGTTSYYLGIEFGGLEGTGFVGFDLDIETIHTYEVDIAIPLDVTGVHLGAYLRITNGGDLDTKANGGIRLCLRDGAGNESYFYVGGKDTYAGGWTYFIADISGTPDANNGTNASITNALYFGVGGKCLAKSGDDNFQMDIMHYGTSGTTVTGSADTGTYGTDKSIEEIYDLVTAGFMGVIARQAGSYVFKAPMVIDTVSFNDSDSIIFFEDLPVSSTFYKISLATTTSNTIAFAGFINKTEGLTACELDFSAGVTLFSFDASTQLTQGVTTFKSGDYSGNKFVSCAGIVANAGANLDGFVSQLSELITLNTTATLKNSDIYKSTGAVSAIFDSLAGTDSNTFTSDGSNHAMELTTAGTYTFSGHTFIDYATIDGVTGNEVIYNNSGGHIQLNKSAVTGTISVRNEGASTTTIVASFNLTLTNIPTGVQVTIVNSTTRVELQNSISTGADIIYSHSGGETVDILLMDLDYDPNLSDIFDLTLDNADQSIKFAMLDDLNYYNPA